MDRAYFIKCLRNIDFKVTRQGVINGPNGKAYGVISSNEVRSMTGDCASLENISNIAFEGNDNSLTLQDGTGVEIFKTTGSIEHVDKEIIQLNKMPTTDSELNDVFSILYPNSYDMMYYDVLDEREMVDMAMFDQQGGVVPLNDYVENIYIDHIERRLKANGFIGPRPPSVEVRRRVLITQIHKHMRNKFRDWVESLTWDGKPRIATWFKKMFKAYAPPLQALKLEDKYLAKVAEAWFIGGIKRMYSKTQHDVVPVLIGGQGVGKSSGLEYTAGPGDWFAATTINISVPGGVAQFLDSVRGKIVVELAEATTIRSADQEALKAFISKTEDQYRKPYMRYEEKFPRHFIMAASTNIANLFTDITGNRRFYPIYCGTMTDEDKKKTRLKEDVEQVWAEALALYRKSKEKGDEKHVWYISSTWKPAVIMQRYCTQDNLNISTIDEWLDDPRNGYTEPGALISKNVIFEDCFGLDITKPIPKDFANSWKAWTNSTTNWQKVFKRMGDDGKPTRGWERIRESGIDFIYDDDEIEAEISEIKEEAESSNKEMCRANLVDHMREIAAKYKLADFDEFPIEDLTKVEIDMLLDEGFIYVGTYDTDWKKCKYVFVGTP